MAFRPMLHLLNVIIHLFYFVSSVDLSLYKDESQIEKKTPGKRKSSSSKKRKNSNGEECVYETPSKKTKSNVNKNSGKTKTTPKHASPKVRSSKSKNLNR